MNQLVVLIVNNPDDCEPILEAWESIGVTGVTILESSGLGRLRQTGCRDDLPLMPSLRDLFEKQEERHRTLLSVVDENKVEDMIESVKGLIGDLNDAHTGFLFVVPVIKAIGLGIKN